MKRRRVGQSSIEVFPIGLGAMPLSIRGRPLESEAIKVIHAALDAGVELIDTANVYCLDDSDRGHNERLIAKALETWPRRKDIYVATKGGLKRPLGAWEIEGDPKSLRAACEKSLRDLRVEQIFLYQLHAPDERFSLVDQIATLARLQEEGKIKYIGISNVSACQITEAQSVTRIETVQNRFNSADKKDLTNRVFDMCEQNNMTYIAYSPVGGGNFHHDLARNEVIKAIAEKYNASPYQILLAWALAQAKFVIAIPGASRSASILDSVQAALLELKQHDLALIDEAFPD
jgi:aryl-alcohol dehydrogenase-like predicted oxidoreductase